MTRSDEGGVLARPRKPTSPFGYFNALLETIRLALLKDIRIPPSLRNGEDLLFERGIDICHETVRFLLVPLQAAVCSQHSAPACEPDEGLPAMESAPR